MTLAEYYKEKGKAEGQEEKTIEIILAGVKKRLDLGLIAEFTLESRHLYLFPTIKEGGQPQ